MAISLTHGSQWQQTTTTNKRCSFVYLSDAAFNTAVVWPPPPVSSVATRTDEHCSFVCFFIGHHRGRCLCFSPMLTLILVAQLEAPVRVRDPAHLRIYVGQSG
ncbi:hypothetical protein BJ912DRAFT_1070111 [Pholiota molesta]|nr:hypothetical protein BJ912DRAFT_1070111 [Pholiota molesta]